MKNIILIISILLAVSCGKGKEALAWMSAEKVVGVYELEFLRLVLLKSGIAEI